MLREKTETSRRLEKSGRITPREVLEAYRETGLNPITKNWHRPGRNEACALSAVALNAGSEGEMNQCLVRRVLDERVSVDYSIFYRDGFAVGFDGHAKPNYENSNLKADDALWGAKGWRDGRRAAAFVFGDVSARPDG